MGSSTVSVQSVIDYAVSRGVPSPLDNPSGYGTQLAVTLANDVMGDIIAERFNWKWNSTQAPPFYTNTWQQDYPQLNNANIGWLETADRIDINNTSLPKPIETLTVRRQLSRTSYATFPVREICWMYNKDLEFGIWPGPNVVYSALVGTNPTAQNPIMSMIDGNGNLLIVTTFGTTGATAPQLAKGSAEGTTVEDGSVVWTVVAPTSKGFRVFPLPGATGPVWKIVPHVQMIAIPITTLQQMIDPIPDDYARIFRTGYETYCLGSSPNPGDLARFERQLPLWLKGMDTMRKQGDREADAYAALPATSPVDCVFPGLRNPQDPAEPY